MKRILIAIILVVFASCCIADDWRNYVNAANKVSKAKYIQDFDIIIQETQNYAECAGIVKEYGVQAWQYNNIANCYIEEFKDRTDYIIRINQIFKMKKDSKDKMESIRRLQLIFIAQITLLKVAKQYLIKAQLLTNKYQDEKRSKKILSNWAFIEYVYKFINWESAKNVTKITPVSVR